MKTLIKKILPSLILYFLFLNINCHQNSERTVNHVIFAWFKEDGKTDQINNVINESLKLKRIKEVKGIHIGKAIPSNRDIVDSSFDLGILIKFDSESDMKNYLANPIHVDFFNSFIKGKTTKLIVYDF